LEYEHFPRYMFIMIAEFEVPSRASYVISIISY
jgi:hypothetical protein